VILYVSISNNPTLNYPEFFRFYLFIKVYFPELLAPLLRTLIQLSSPPFILSEDVASEDGLTVTMSYNVRSLSKETPFWSAFCLWFAFEPVLARRRTANIKDGTPPLPWRRFGSSVDGHVFVFIARRRPDSLTWEVPDNDQDLMDGVGAYNTRSRKGDDTFETLLLMALGDDEDY